MTSTVPANGDQNPYAIVVAPVSAGKIQKDDVLVDNFNDKNNLQGLGTTIVDYNPTTKKLALFAAIPRNLPQCPGGVGLTTAMTMLKTGWVIVGSLPSQDGTTKTKGQGCLIVLDSAGRRRRRHRRAEHQRPVGQHGGDRQRCDRDAVRQQHRVRRRPARRRTAGGEQGDRAAHRAVDRRGQAADGDQQTVIASGFGEQADKDVFIIGPTGLALGAGGVLYVSDALGNRIVAIPNAATRTDSAGTGARSPRTACSSARWRWRPRRMAT